MTPKQCEVWERAIQVVRQHWKHGRECVSERNCVCGKLDFVRLMRATMKEG